MDWLNDRKGTVVNQLATVIDQFDVKREISLFVENIARFVPNDQLEFVVNFLKQLLDDIVSGLTIMTTSGMVPK